MNGGIFQGQHRAHFYLKYSHTRGPTLRNFVFWYLVTWQVNIGW